MKLEAHFNSIAINDAYFGSKLIMARVYLDARSRKRDSNAGKKYNDCNTRDTVEERGDFRTDHADKCVRPL